MNIVEAIEYLKLNPKSKVIVSSYEYSTDGGDIYSEDINYRLGENPDKKVLVKVKQVPIEHILSNSWKIIDA